MRHYVYIHAKDLNLDFFSNHSGTLLDAKVWNMTSCFLPPAA